MWCEDSSPAVSHALEGLLHMCWYYIIITIIGGVMCYNSVLRCIHGCVSHAWVFFTGQRGTACTNKAQTPALRLSTA